MKKILSTVLFLGCLAVSTRAALIANGSFEADPVGTSVTSPPDVVDATSITGWRVFDTNSANVAFSATIISTTDTNAGAGTNAIELNVNNTGGSGGYGLDQGNVGMHTPVQFGTNYLISFDAAWIAGATTNNLVAYVQEFNNTGTYIGNSHNLGVISISATGYQTFTFLWTPVNPGTTEIGFFFRPMLNVVGATTVSLDNVQMTQASSSPYPFNGSFEADPVGTSVTTPPDGFNTTTFTDWRFYNAGQSDTLFTGTIIPTTDTNSGAGSNAMQLNTVNATSGGAGSYGLDLGGGFAKMIPVSDTAYYIISYDAAWVAGVTVNNLGLIVVQYDSTNVFLGQPVYFSSISDTNYHTFNFLYSPVAGTVKISPVFQPMLNAVGATTLNLDNVKVEVLLATNLPVNGSFEYSPLGAAATSGGGGTVFDSSTFLGWRFVNNAPSSYTTFNAVIVTNASAGKQAMQLTAVNADGGGGGSVDLDMDSNRLPINDTKTYLLTFDAAWVSGATAKSLAVILAQFDVNGTFLGQPIYTYSVSSTNYQKFTIYYQPTPGTTQLSLCFQPLLNTVGSTTLLLDNVQWVDASTIPAPWNGSFEYSPAGAVVNAPQGGGNVVDDTTLVGWRFVGMDAANVSFSASIITNASAGKQALRMDLSAAGTASSWIDQWDASMHTPVTYGQTHLVSFDAAYISGASPYILEIAAQEFNSDGSYANTVEGIGNASVSSTNYQKFAFLWTLQNSSASDLSLQIIPSAGSASVDNIQIVNITNLPTPLNGKFEYSPIGTTSTIGTGGGIDTSTFLGWRLFSVGAPAINAFTGTIVDAGGYAGGTPGSHAMRLDINNTGSPTNFDYGLDNDVARVPVVIGNHYTLAFDLELDGTTGGTELCEVGIAELDASGTFLGNAVIYTPTLPTDQTFHHYSVDYVPQNANTAKIAIAFRPHDPGYVATLVLDNVVFASYVPVASTPTLGSAQMSGHAFQMTFNGPANQSYEVLSSTNVALPVARWVTNSSGTFNGSPVIYTNNSPAGQEYYRIKSP